MIRPFISVTALVASLGDEKHTKPKPLDLPSPFLMTFVLVMLPYLVNSFRSRSSSTSSSRFFTYRLTPWNNQERIKERERVTVRVRYSTIELETNKLHSVFNTCRRVLDIPEVVKLLEAIRSIDVVCVPVGYACAQIGSI